MLLASKHLRQSVIFDMSFEKLFKNKLHRVFVYGTLKRNEPNHHFLTNTSNGHAEFLGLGRTMTSYPLVIATRYNIPFLLKKPDTGNRVLGEVYEVDTDMLSKLDELEDHPQFYVRTEEEILMASEDLINQGDTFERIGEWFKAWIYTLPKFNNSLLEKPMYISYSSTGSHGLKYCEKYKRDPSYDYKNEVLK